MLKYSGMFLLHTFHSLDYATCSTILSRNLLDKRPNAIGYLNKRPNVIGYLDKRLTKMKKGHMRDSIVSTVLFVLFPIVCKIVTVKMCLTANIKTC